VCKVRKAVAGLNMSGHMKNPESWESKARSVRIKAGR
jgi:hypothetical protein